MIPYRNGEDPFEDCDVVNDDTELTDLISRVQMENSCSVEELIHGEDVVPMCREVAGDGWQEVFFSELGPVCKQLNTEDDDCVEVCSEEVDIVEVEHTTTVNSYSDAIRVLEDVCHYLEQKGHTHEATTVSSFVSTIADISYKAFASGRQSRITDFFSTAVNSCYSILTT